VRRLLATVTVIAGCGDNRLAAIDARPADAGDGSGCGADVTVDDLALEIVARGLSEPVWVGAPPGDPRLFVIERAGRIRIVRDGELLATPFLTIPVRTDSVEQGLLGLAFPPDFATDPRVYVAYTDELSEAQVIAEYRVSADPDVAVAAERRLLELAKTSDYHNGGAIGFGPDGYLYIATGDDTISVLAQDPTSLLGKMLRIDPAARGGAEYTIPPDNPFAGTLGAEREEIWAVGLRNPWRFSFDRATGDLYLGDVGQWLREEIDVVPAGTGAGANFGWRIREATLCHNPDDFYDEGFGPCSVPGEEIVPAVETGRGAIVGGHVYRGACMPGLDGVYFFSDNTYDFLRTFRWQGGVVTDEVDITDSIAGEAPGFVTSLGEDAAGELYVVTFYLESGAEDGVVSKIVPRP
jgi:glucose/arabinose dehydrogenase